MRAAVISDIHANLEALESVCRAAEQRDVENWVCLGDIVGYGADPGLCLQRLQELTDQVVLGNHDAAAVGLLDLSHFNPYARRAALWTADQLTQAQRDSVTALPLTRESGEALFVHAEPRDPAAWNYVFSSADAAAAMAATRARCCFIGHSHQPFVCCLPAGQDDRVRWNPVQTGRVDLHEDDRFLVNVGSVGQPRDGDPRACFAIWDDRENTVEFVRVAYDLAAARGKILAAGLPAYLADRLSAGR